MAMLTMTIRVVIHMVLDSLSPPSTASAASAVVEVLAVVVIDFHVAVGPWRRLSAAAWSRPSSGRACRRRVVFAHLEKGASGPPEKIMGRFLKVGSIFPGGLGFQHEPRSGRSRKYHVSGMKSEIHVMINTGSC